MKATKERRQVWWLGALPVIVLVANLFALGLMYAYSTLNLRPFMPAHDPFNILGQSMVTFVGFLFLLPMIGSLIYLWPALRWLRARQAELDVSPKLIQRAANAPAVFALFTAAGWVVVSVVTLMRLWLLLAEATPGVWVHFFIRPILTGMVATAGVFFVADFICRWQVWPLIFANRAVVDTPGVWKIRLLHRLIMFWGTISFLPLSAVALIAYVRLEPLVGSTELLPGRVMYAIVLIGLSAALGGACLAWLLSRTMVSPLRLLEKAMERVRGGDFGVRVGVGATDEIGALQLGFNEMTGRIAQSYEALRAKNRELETALDKVAYLEAVKRGLDRFVPDTVRRLIEENPQAPALQKVAKDVSVLFVDIQGYTALSEELPPAELNEIVENYFSMYLSDIRSAGGDINETAGDGLMIIFQEGAPIQHAHSAVRVALAIRRKTTAKNQEEEGRHPPLVVNMGVSSGECEVGSTKLRGATGERWTFTASGPVTNLAARLGDYADDGQILISAETAQRIRDVFHLSRTGSIELKNIGHAVEVWHVEDEI